MIRISWQSEDGQWGNSIWTTLEDAEKTFKLMIKLARKTLKGKK